jgi:hypothetical protein
LVAREKNEEKTMNTVDALLSRAEISETIFRYARGFDRMDLEMALSCFHADSVHDHGKFHGFSQDFCKYAIAMLAELAVTPGVHPGGARVAG